MFPSDFVRKTIFSEHLEKQNMVFLAVPALIVPLPVKRFSSKLTPKVPNNIPRNSSFCYFALFLIVSLMPFINHPDSSRDLAIFILFISLLETVSVVQRDPDIFL